MSETATRPRAKVDFSRSSVSRYLQLATLFRRRIDAGEWPVGRQIPTVEELVDECGVARATVRQALGLLEGEGLIERLRAKGTFVRRRPGERLWSDVETDLSGLLRTREPARIEVLAGPEERMPPSFPHPIGEPAEGYQYLRRRHWRRGTPFVVTEVHFASSVFALVDPRDLQTKASLQLVQGLPGVEIVRAHQTLTIETADIETADLLSIPLNAPVALIQRTAVDGNGTIIVRAEGLYRGDMVRVDIALR